MSTPTSGVCSTCNRNPNVGEAALQRCGGCKTRSYCSTTCQRNDWSRGHKQQCHITTLSNEAQTTAALHTGGTVLAVRLACKKDSGGFEKENIPNNHAIFDGLLLQVPALMGIPLVIHRVGTESNNRAELDCPIATFLNVTYETGFAPPQWQSQVGTCIVARKDKKPLSEEHLEAVWMYIDWLMDVFGDEGPKAAQKKTSKKCFEGWFETYKKNEAKNGRENWSAVDSVYEV